MKDANFWKTVAIRFELLDALRKEHKKTGSPEDTPTRIVDKLVRAHLKKKGIKLGAE